MNSTDNPDLMIDELPSMPAAAFQIMQLVLDPDVSMERLSEEIQKDVGLSAKIIKIVNSPAYPAAESIVDLKHAVVSLGLQTVKNLALSLCIMDNLKGSIDEKIYQQIFNLSLCNATTTSLLSHENNIKDSADLYFCGLVQYIGLFVLAGSMKEVYWRLYEESLDKGLRFIKVLEEKIHIKHNDIGYNLAVKWHFPKVVCESLKYQEDPHAAPLDELTLQEIKVYETVHLSMLATEIFIAPGKSLNIEKFKQRYNDYYNFTTKESEKKLTKLGRKINETLAKMNIDIPAQSSYTAVLKEANQELGKINVQYESMYHEINLVNEKLAVTNLELKTKNKVLMKVAAYDFLTGLNNRARFNKELDIFLSLCKRRKARLAIIFIELSNLKQINDQYGSKISDEFLKIAANKILKSTRSDEFLARVSSDSFGIVLPNLKTEQDPSYVADRILKLFSETICIEDKKIDDVLVSIGIACYPNAGHCEDELIKNANIALLRAKNTGKNKFQYFTDELSLLSNRRIALDKAFKSAFEKDEFRMVYQPIIELKKNSVFGFESQMRWKSQQLGAVAPSEFLEFSELNGMIKHLDCWQIERCMQQIKKWQALELIEPNELVFSLNISAKQFFKEGFFEYITSEISNNKLSPSTINIELSEGSVMAHKAQEDCIFRKLVDFGVQTNIDNFGSGLFSLQQLKNMPFNCLKIDASYIQGILNNMNSATVVEGIIALAKIMGLKTIAQGIESKEQLDFVLAKGCDYAQGDYFSSPVEATEVPSLINKFK